jgi:hypothetical protein
MEVPTILGIPLARRSGLRGHADPSDEDEDSANEDLQEEASDDAASDDEAEERLPDA